MRDRSSGGGSSSVAPWRWRGSCGGAGGLPYGTLLALNRAGSRSKWCSRRTCGVLAWGASLGGVRFAAVVACGSRRSLLSVKRSTVELHSFEILYPVMCTSVSCV